MFSKVYSGNISGVDAQPVCVEADVAGGLPQFNMVGLLSSEVKEAKERVERAFFNSGFDFPARKITINLAPAGLRKQGSGFDVPIAVSILAAMGIVDEKATENTLFVGELGLDGSINRVNGVLAMAMMAKDRGFGKMVVPAANAYEGAAIDGIKISGVSSLQELVICMKENCLPETEHIDLEDQLIRAYMEDEQDYADIKGQEKAKRATMTAVAGFHNILYIGPPGSGKSMLARRIPSINTRLSRDESLEISKIYSVMGLLPDDSLILNRPFRSPHHSITGPGLVGGQGNPRPGEVTLAHKGVLFLDEAAEFKKDVLEMLRQPVEDKQVVISRVSGSMVFPADFMLVMAMNPCRCGYYPDRQHCRCTQSEVDRYFGKIRGPVLDRVDICVGTSRLDPDDLDRKETVSSEEMRKTIAAARDIQNERFSGKDIRFNSQMSRKDIEVYCCLDPENRELLDEAYRKYNMSARGYYKILKVARTIADLEGSVKIMRDHLFEAISYRNMYVD